MKSPSSVPSSKSLVFTESCFRQPIQVDLQSTFEMLSRSYHLFLLTPANFSQMPPDVRQFFREVSPSGAQLQKLPQEIGIPREQIILIGTNYHLEIHPASMTGLKAAWINSTFTPSPGLLPLHTYEIETLAHLPAILEQDENPDYQTCLLWLLQHDASHNLLGHVHLVASLSYLLACLLREKQISIDPILVHRAGMLHDIAKIRALGSDKDHGTYGSELLTDLGLPLFAEITRRHVLNAILNPARAPRTWEEKLVYYADKIAESAKLVTVQDRIQKLSERYEPYREDILRCLDPLLALQDEICAILGMNSTDLYARLKQELKRNSMTNAM